jgi:hypothetical protein
MVALNYANPISGTTSNTDCVSSSSSASLSGVDCLYQYFGVTFPTSAGPVLATANVTRTDGVAAIASDKDTTCTVKAVWPKAPVHKQFNADCYNSKVPGGQFGLNILQVPTRKAVLLP